MVKKPKLTPEEKKLLKQEKKLAKKLALEEQQRQFKRDELSREIQYGLLTRKKLQEKWTQMLMDIKLPILKTDFQLAVNNMELMMDIKDYQISLLIDELDEAEEQHRFASRAHHDNIELILRTYSRRLDDLKLTFDKKYSTIVKEAGWETARYKEAREADQQYINTMNFHLEYDRHKVDSDLRTNYFAKLKEYTTENSDSIGIMVNHEETIFENVWHAFKGVLRDYLVNTAEKKKSCDLSYTSDVAICKLIKTQSAQLYNLYKILYKYKDKQMFEKEDVDKCVHYKQEESVYFCKMYRTLRSNLECDIKRDDQKLADLVILSNSVLKDLKNKIKICETLLRLYAIIRKFERQKEKILPFYKQAPVRRTKHAPHSDMEYMITVDTHVMKELEPFWMKCGQGDAIRQQINEEKDYLQRENALLKQHVAKYCAGTKYPCSELKMKSSQLVCYKIK